MTEARTIDLSPTWPEAVEILIAALENGTSSGQAAARAEFRRMAQTLDRLANEPDDDAEARAVFEIITSRADGSQPYGVTVATNAAAQDYAETMRRAGYHAEPCAVEVQRTAKAALADAAAYYADERLQERKP